MLHVKIKSDEVVFLGDDAQFSRLPGPGGLALIAKANKQLSLPIGDVLSVGGKLKFRMDVGDTVCVGTNIMVERISLSQFGVTAPSEITIRVERRPGLGVTGGRLAA